MTGSQRVILLACGSFNPPTNMHLRMFEIAKDFLHRTTNYNVVAGLMSPVHDKYGKEGLASAGDRIQMLRLALNSSSWVHVSEWETTQDDWTPTREAVQYHQNLIQTTLHKLGRSSSRARHPSRELVDSVVNGNLDPTAKRQRLDASQSWLNHLTTSTDPVVVKLLCGADLLESFAKPGLWKEEDIEALVGKYGIVVITREGSNPYKFIYESDLLTKHQKNIHIVTEWITNEVSSTKVRRALRRGESVKYLVQDSVIDYIYKNALFNTHNNSKYFYSPFMLTPSPNPDTDVLLPPPNFTLGQSHGRSRGTLLASRQHPIRKSTIYSDMEDDSTGGSMDDPPVVPTHSSIGKSYPGMAIPVKQKSHSHLEVGPEAKDKSKARAEATDSRPADLFDTAKVTAPSRFFQECFPLRDTSNISDLPHLETSHSLDEVELSSSTLTPDYLQDKMTAKSAPQSRGTSPSTNKLPSLQSFILSPKKSPVKSDPIPIPRKAFSSHSRSKSSVALKPERAFELAQSARDDISLLQRETSNMTLGGSNIYELLSKTTQVSPSHTEMCLTYMPKKPEAPSSWERSRGHSRNEHLFTSRSLERPSTPKHNKHLSSIHKVSSLPLQHTRDRSPSPVRNPSHWRLERQAAQFVRENTYDLKDMELGKLRRTLTHEEEINLILSGDPKYLTKMKSPDSFTPPEMQDMDGFLNYNSYEMKF